MNPNTDLYNAIIFDSSGTSVLLKKGETTLSLSLPSIEIPKFRRVAQEITAKCRTAWNLAALLLYSATLSGEQEAFHYVAIDCRSQLQVLPQGMRWVTTDRAISQVSDALQAEAIRASIAKAIRAKSVDDPEPFSRLGWMDDLVAWIKLQLPGAILEAADFRQFNGSETFSLVRFDSNYGPLWFKAVGEPNLHEYSVTTGLAKYFPDSLPSVIGFIPQWHGWLMKDTDSKRLYESRDLNDWVRAARMLAEFQSASASKTNELRAIGCIDRQVSSLADRIPYFIEIVRDLMPKQPSSPPARLSSREITELEGLLISMCGQLLALEIPDSLVHGDLTGGNVQINDNRCVLIDWAEAYISHPFVDLEFLLVHLPKECQANSIWKESVTESYLEAWRPLISKRAIQEALRLTPLFALLLHALPARGDFYPEQIEQPEFGKYIRSLTRRMWREAQQLIEIAQA